jgi:hypothetical protein
MMSIIALQKWPRIPNDCEVSPRTHNNLVSCPSLCATSYSVSKKCKSKTTAPSFSIFFSRLSSPSLTRTDLHGICARVRNPSSRRPGGAALCVAADQCLQRPVAVCLGIARTLSICIGIIFLFLIITIFIIVIFTISDIESGHQSLRAVAGRSGHRRRLSARLCGVCAQLGCGSMRMANRCGRII